MIGEMKTEAELNSERKEYMSRWDQMTREEAYAEIVITPCDSGVSWDDEDPKLFMTWKGGAAHYFVRVNPSTKFGEVTVEVPADVYRDVMATMRLSARHALVDLLGRVNVEALADWINEITDRP